MKELKTGEPITLCPICQNDCGFEIKNLLSDNEVQEAVVVCNDDFPIRPEVSS